MSEATTTSEDHRPKSVPDSLILGSRIVRFSIVVLMIFALLYSVPAVPLSFRRVLSTNVGPVLFLALSVFACWRGLRLLPSPSAISFWRMMGAAFFLWLIVRSVLPYTKPYFPIVSSVSSDFLYALYYLLMILAIEIRPHLHRTWSLSSVERALTWPAVALFVLGLFIYFVFIPLWVSPQQYATLVPSMFFFLALDLYIGARLLVLAIRVPSRGWTMAYGALSAGMLGFAVGDLIELLQHKGVLDYSLGHPGDLVWLAPFLGIIIGARVQRRLPDSPAHFEELFDPQQQLILLAFVLPVIHFLGYGLGIFNDSGRDLREATTLFWLLVLGTLAFTQQILLQRKTRQLALETHEATEALRQSERTVRLMTQRQQAVEAQRQSEINFSRVFNASPDPMIIFTRRHRRIVELNDSFERFWASDREAIAGHTIDQLSLIHPRDLQSLTDSTDHTRGVHDFPAHVRTSSGDTRQCLLAAEAIEFSGESSIVLAIRDVTEQIELEAFRDSLIEQLEAKNAELERFTYTVSHDLKSPLITIRGFLGFLEEDIEKGNRERLSDDLRRINEASSRMQRLLDELLELSRVGRIVSDPEPVPLATLLRESLELVEGPLEERRVLILTANLDEAPSVYGDPLRLLEVFQNLLENAVKFMGDQPDPTIEIDWDLVADDRVRVRIADNGIGIESRFHQKIFGLFEQLQPREQGTGIGLALVKRIIELHGGEIAVESEGSGEGSVFLFTLPLPPEERTS